MGKVLHDGNYMVVNYYKTLWAIKDTTSDMGVITNLPPSNTRNLDNTDNIAICTRNDFSEDGANEMPIIPGL
jgi:hypothetical protein